jgi:hypothetical protein
MGQTAEAMEVIMAEAVTTAEVVTTAEAVTTVEAVTTAEVVITEADITVAVIGDASAALLKKSNVYDPNFGGTLP